MPDYLPTPVRVPAALAVGGRRVALAWVCQHCDRADSGLRLPRGWTL